MALAWILRTLGGLWSQPVVRYGLAALALYMWAYTSGKRDAADRYARKSAEMAEEWAGRVADAREEAFGKGVAAAQQAAANAVKSKEIGNVARSEPGAGDQCLSGDVYGRLRDVN